MQRRIAILTFLALAACGSSQQQSETVATQQAESLRVEEIGSVPKLHRFGDIYLAGQPKAEDFTLFRERGVRTVFNLRHDSETPELNERQLVEALGMTYIYLPWNGPAELTDQVLDEMRAVLVDAPRPILFHCASANRVGAAWLAYRVLDQGIALEDAHAEALEVGMRTPAYETKTLEYVRSRK
jgi:uncharacterized protein (TIGR01244 family)